MAQYQFHLFLNVLKILKVSHSEILKNIMAKNGEKFVQGMQYCESTRTKQKKLYEAKND